MIRSFCALFLSTLLALPPAFAQPPAAPLQILVLEGEGVTNNIRTQSVTIPVVEVHDENDLPVAGAEVDFLMPIGGAGGLFENGMPSIRKITNAQGQAAPSRMTINAAEGAFAIRVRATSRGRTGTIDVHQVNSNLLFLPTGETAEKKSSKKWLWIALIGGGAAAGLAVGLTRGSPSPSITVSPGPVVFGGPR